MRQDFTHNRQKPEVTDEIVEKLITLRYDFDCYPTCNGGTVAIVPFVGEVIWWLINKHGLYVSPRQVHHERKSWWVGDIIRLDNCKLDLDAINSGIHVYDRNHVDSYKTIERAAMEAISVALDLISKKP